MLPITLQPLPSNSGTTQCLADAPSLVTIHAPSAHECNILKYSRGYDGVGEVQIGFLTSESSRPSQHGGGHGSS